MEKGVTKVDGHYQLPLLFRHENVKMPDNRHQAVQRALSVRKCFKDQQFYDDYVKFMKNIIEKRYAKKVAMSCLKTGEGKVGIYHTMVFITQRNWTRFGLYLTVTVSTKVGLLIKNSCRVVGVLSRFRQEPTAFMVDIKAMFYQVFVPEEQRSYLLFL